MLRFSKYTHHLPTHPPYPLLHIPLHSPSILFSALALFLPPLHLIICPSFSPHSPFISHLFIFYPFCITSPYFTYLFIALTPSLHISQVSPLTSLVFVICWLVKQAHKSCYCYCIWEIETDLFAVFNCYNNDGMRGVKVLLGVVRGILIDGRCG